MNGDNNTRGSLDCTRPFLHSAEFVSLVVGFVNSLQVVTTYAYIENMV
jgi:hypothetical protein